MILVLVAFFVIRSFYFTSFGYKFGPMVKISLTIIEYATNMIFLKLFNTTTLYSYCLECLPNVKEIIIPFKFTI